MKMYTVEVRYIDVTGANDPIKPNYVTKLYNDYLIIDATGKGSAFLSKKDARRVIKKSVEMWGELGYTRPGGARWSQRDFIIVDANNKIEIPAERLKVLE